MAENTLYYEFPDGSVAARDVVGDGPVTPPDDATEITEAEYQTALAAIQDANAENQAEREAAEQATARDDYDALIAAGIPDTTARRLTGYQGTPA